MEYKVISKKLKESKITESLKEFLIAEFSDKGVRLGLPNFTKKFGKFNEQKGTLMASSVPSVSDIQLACRLTAEELKSKGSKTIPCLISNNDGVVTVEVKGIEEFETFYPKINGVKSPVDPTSFVINYMTKHQNEIDFSLIKNCLNGLTE